MARKALAVITCLAGQASYRCRPLNRTLGVMKFFAILILPKHTNASDARLVEHTASVLMRPFKMWEDDVPAENGFWDYYWCCTKEWMEERRIDHAAYPSTVSRQAPIVFPVAQVPLAGMTDSIITPNGEWHRSKGSYAEEDPSWAPEALNICRSFAGHFAVLLYCHG